MDFFEQQAKAHRKTKWLVLYFAMAVLGMIAAIYIAAMLVFSGIQSRQAYVVNQTWTFSYWNPEILLWVGLATLAIIGIGSGYKAAALSAGGSAVSELMGGRLIVPTTQDPDERRLLDVVEEMAIASGVPRPQVYVMDDEDVINAFAAGHKASDATVTVTRGCLQLLSRDQLQGVIGHEFSHILNGDMRLNLRLMGIVFGILCVAIIGRVLIQSGMTGGSRSRGQNPLPLVGIVLLIVGYIGVFFGRLIQAAVSRQREFLADASSVQFTRNPAGITGALKQIGGLGVAGSRLSHAHAEELSHMFFGNGVSEPWFSLLETHPPLIQRIRVFEPDFDGMFAVVRYDEKRRDEPPARKPAPMPNLFGTVLGGMVLSSGDPGRPPVVRPHVVLPAIGNPTPLHLKYAEALRDSLPDGIKAAARDPGGAMALVYAMLLNDNKAERQRQLDGLRTRADDATLKQTVALYDDVAAAAAHAHLPMLNLALGALWHLTSEQTAQFLQTLDWLIASDGKTGMFEFALKKIITHHLAPHSSKVRRAVVQYYSMKPLVPDCAVLLSALARVGTAEPAEVQKAFEAGAPWLRAPDGAVMELLPGEQCGVEQMDAALNRLAT
ncbi:MAG: M48 family metalloprotease, partial [Verrucomicrobia bacterium]|nr:M48 family metalloprotease [Verrucomicrobiota bacterium]